MPPDIKAITRCPECGRTSDSPSPRAHWLSIWRVLPLLIGLGVVCWFGYTQTRSMTTLPGIPHSANSVARYGNPPLTIGELRAVARGAPDARHSSLREMLDLPSARSTSAIHTSEYEVLAITTLDSGGSLIMRRSIGWPLAWCTLDDWSGFASTATLIPESPQDRVHAPMIANGGRGSWVLPSPDARFTRELNIDLNAIGLSSALLLAVWHTARVLRGRVGTSRSHALRFAALCCLMAALGMALVSAPWHRTCVIWTWGLMDPASPAQLRTQLTAGEVISLIQSDRGIETCATGVLAGLDGKPDNTRIGLAYVLQAGASTQTDMTILGRFPSMMRHSSRRLLDASGAPVSLPARRGHLVWRDLPFLRWQATTTDGIERFTLVDLPAIVARLMLAGGAWAVATGVSRLIWTLRQRARVQNYRCIACGYALPV